MLRYSAEVLCMELDYEIISRFIGEELEGF